VWAVLFVVVCLQIVADRTNRRFDLTAGGALTLAPVTQQVLDGLAAPLHVTVLYDRGNRGQYATLLKRLAVASPRVETTLYDLDRYPERAPAWVGAPARRRGLRRRHRGAGRDRGVRAAFEGIRDRARR
jgi:hypothetical protein